MEHMRNGAIINEVQKNLTKDVTTNSNEVRKYFDALKR